MDPNTTNQSSRSRSLRRLDLVEPELSYVVVGALYRVYNGLGPGLAEKHYQRALASVFDEQGIVYRQQVHVPIAFDDVVVGRYFVDFVVGNRIVLEIKQGDFCSPDHLLQVKRYLAALNLPLGILANFGSRRVVYRRILPAR